MLAQRPGLPGPCDLCRLVRMFEIVTNQARSLLGVGNFGAPPKPPCATSAPSRNALAAAGHTERFAHVLGHVGFHQGVRLNQ